MFMAGGSSIGRSVIMESTLSDGGSRKTDHDGTRLRLVEYRIEMEPHWCDRGHIGRVLEGSFEIEFPGATIIYGPGDGVFIPSGDEHRQRAKVIDGPVLALFVEQV